VDLSRGKASILDFPLSLRRTLLGARGVTVHRLFRELKADVDPMSPENLLCIAPGLLTGGLAPSASRFNVSCRSPETGFLGDANAGGFFGKAMRHAGFDMLVIRGRADRPTYLLCEDSRIELFDASELWGLDTRETQLRIKDSLGQDTQSLVIGPAGENLVRYACPIHGNKNAPGRCGSGAVMGSKRLKGVACRGDRPLEIAEPDALLEYMFRLRDELTKSKVIKAYGKYGTQLLYGPSHEHATIRVNNSQLNRLDGARLFDRDFEPFTEKMLSCSSCFVHCRHRNRLGGEGPEYSTVGLLGSNLGIGEPEPVIELGNLCNELGLDVSSTGSYISWAVELYQRGIITNNLTEDELEFNNPAQVTGLIEDIAHRRGFGDLLAEGRLAAKNFGDGSNYYLISIKNLPPSDPHDFRYFKSFALGEAVASRGADHLRNRPTLDILGLPEELVKKIYGEGISVEPTSYDGKELAVAFSDDLFACQDALGLCRFVCHAWNSPHLLGYEHFSRLIGLFTGLELPVDELCRVGGRIIDMERLVNIRLGLTPDMDTVPSRFLKEPLTEGPSAGEKIEDDKLRKAVGRYYGLRGWDEHGRPAARREAELEAIS